jgi:hypothetical protein
MVKAHNIRHYNKIEEVSQAKTFKTQNHLKLNQLTVTQSKHSTQCKVEANLTYLFLDQAMPHKNNLIKHQEQIFKLQDLRKRSSM